MRKKMKSPRCLLVRPRRAVRRNWSKNDASRRYCRNCHRLRMKMRRSSLRCTRHIKMHDCVMIYRSQYEYPQVGLSSCLSRHEDKMFVLYQISLLMHPVQNETACPKSGTLIQSHNYIQMHKKPSLSIECKQSSLLKSHDSSANHSLSRKKRYLTVVTPSQLQHKPIKTLKEIKSIALGHKTNPSLPCPQKVIKRKVVPIPQIPSFISENKTWKRQLTLEVKPLQPLQKSVECSARTMQTKLEYSRLQVPQTPINRLLFDPIVNHYYQ